MALTLSGTLLWSTGCGDEDLESGRGRDRIPVLSEMVGPTGGIVMASDGSVALVLPPGALSEMVEITVDDVADSVRGYDLNTPVYEFGPEGTTFALPVTVQFQAADGVVFWTLPGSQTYAALPTTGGPGVRSAQVTHFSRGFVGFLSEGEEPAPPPVPVFDAGVSVPDGGIANPDSGVANPDGGVEPDGGVVDSGLPRPDAGATPPDAGASVSVESAFCAAALSCEAPVDAACSRTLGSFLSEADPICPTLLQGCISVYAAGGCGPFLGCASAYGSLGEVFCHPFEI